jgi:hypothetical protein
MPRPCRAQRSRACHRHWQATPDSPESHGSHSTQLNTTPPSSLTVLRSARLEQEDGGEKERTQRNTILQLAICHLIDSVFTASDLLRCNYLISCHRRRYFWSHSINQTGHCFNMTNLNENARLTAGPTAPLNYTLVRESGPAIARADFTFTRYLSILVSS